MDGKEKTRMNKRLYTAAMSAWAGVAQAVRKFFRAFYPYKERELKASTSRNRLSQQGKRKRAAWVRDNHKRK